MAILTESTVEEAALEVFSGLGYTNLHGPDIAPGELLEERTSYGDVVLGKRLREALLPKLIFGEIRVKDSTIGQAV